MKIIKAGFLVSYDYEYIKTSLPIVYPYLSELILCIDINRKTWTGQSFNIPYNFFEWLNKFDKDKKIVIYEDNFFVPNLTTMECETRERIMLCEKMGKCDWYIQIDTDEYIMDFETVIKRLNTYDAIDPITIYGRIAPIFKLTAKGILLITEAVEHIPFVTNVPSFTVARHNSKNMCIIWEDIIVLHQSWARESEEILMKLNNWGHKDDFNTSSYFNLWNVADEYNYIYLQNFHPLDQTTWPKLEFIPTSNILDLVNEKDDIYRYYPLPKD